MINFDFSTFNEKLKSGDRNGLEYLEKTIIADLKEKNKDSLFYTKEDYLINLFYATLELNTCNDIYETSNIKNNFNFEIYAVVRDKFLEEFCYYYGYDYNRLYK